MPHGRAQIRTAVMSALEPALAPVPVLVEIVRRFEDTALPAVVVSLGDDEQDDDQRTMGNLYEVERQQTLNVEIHTEGDTGELAAARIDDLEVLVEQALADDTSLGGIAENIVFSQSAIEYSDDQVTVKASRTIQYIVMWRHEFGAPDTPEG